MFLCMDEYGRIYQSSRDREDGTGFEVYPEEVSMQDVTLQSTAIRAAEKTKKMWDNLAKYNAIEDSKELNKRYDEQNKIISQDQINERLDTERLNPAYQVNLTTEAAIQSMSGADFSQHAIWSNSSGRYSNGIGRTKNEKLTELAWLQQTGRVPASSYFQGIGEADVQSVDKEEIEQYQLQKEHDVKKEIDANKAILENNQSLLPSTEVKKSLLENKTIKNLAIGLLVLTGYKLLKG